MTIDEGQQVALQTGAAELGLKLDGSQISAFSIFSGLLGKWNRKLNLTRVAPEDIVPLHFLDSLSCTLAL